jgi:ubiquitin carboxyl-terminal hydrolase L3
MQKEEDDWMPLESNPEVINSYIADLGFDATNYKLTDVLSTEDWALEMIPKPTIAAIFLFPINDKQENARKEENERILKDGQKVSEKVSSS